MLPRLSCRFNVATSSIWRLSRAYASISDSIVPQPHPPEPPQDLEPVKATNLPVIDHHILQAVSKRPPTTLKGIVQQYLRRSGTVLDVSLPYESRPGEHRRPRLTGGSGKEVVTVAHCISSGAEQKMTLSSGFALKVGNGPETFILTCAHTLEEIKHSPLFLAEEDSASNHNTGTFILTGAGENVEVYPVSDVVSALPRSDLLILSCRLPPGTINALPVSPYPAHKDTSIVAHFVSQTKPDQEGWEPWIGDTWGKWVKGKILGYRDFAGREAEPGTYDALSHLFFTPLPTAGSSGGPIIDEETGAVVGVMLGTRTESSRIEGIRGWGVPSEVIYEMFALPGLEGKK